MKNRNLEHSNHWATPPFVYDELNKCYNFDFDPCPYNEGEIAPETDGLKIEWGDCNYVNPPYSRSLKEAFVRRCVEMQKRGKTSVALLPVSTSTKLFHDVILPNATDIKFLRGRVHFEGRNSKGEWVTEKAGKKDSMLVEFLAK